MATSSEKRALIFLASLAALGLSVRAFRGGSRAGGDSAGALDLQIAAVDSATARRNSRGSSGKRPAARPLRDRSDSLELSGAREDAMSRGRRTGSGDADALALYEKRRRDVAEANRASQERLDELSRVIAVTPKTPATSGRPDPRRRADPVDLDTADEVTIATVPWIGPALAARIVADRRYRGTFGSLEGLQRVAGVGPGLGARIAQYVRFSGTGMGPAKVIPLRKRGP
jgi:DNA uptake protein ComE-like DNA-binding protein